MKTPHKLVAGLGTSMLIGAGLVLLAGAAPASAHTPNVVSTCDDVTVTLTNYGASDNNTITVTVDGTIVEESTFGNGFSETYLFSDRSVAHSYTVVVDAPGTAYDVHESKVSVPCPVPAVPADASATLEVLPPTCDVPGRLVLGEIVNATWATPTAVSGPADYSVEANAISGHTFADGTKSLTFSGHLEGTLDSVEDGCEAPPKPEAIVTSTPVEDEDCTSTTVTTTTTTVTTDWVLQEASNTWVMGSPVTTVTTVVRDATPGECPVVETPPTPTVPPVVVPPTETPTAPTPVMVEATGADTLPSTGSETGWALPLAAGLLLAGIALMLVRRTRRA